MRTLLNFDNQLIFLSCALLTSVLDAPVLPVALEGKQGKTCSWRLASYDYPSSHFLFRSRELFNIFIPIARPHSDILHPGQLLCISVMGFVNAVYIS